MMSSPYGAINNSKYNNTTTSKLSNGRTQLDVEEAMLDEVEASTRRIFKQSKNLNEEAVTHLQLLGHVDSDMELATRALRKEALHAEAVSKNRGGVCWMYCIILMELVLLFTLIMYGLQ